MDFNNQKVNKPITKGIANVPMVMQMEALECGAACLTMILAYYGKWIPLEQVRVAAGVSRDGSNALNIVEAAEKYGLEADGYKFEIEDLEKECTFPCIIHWEFEHFVVLDGIVNNKVYINDPGRGKVIISKEEFSKSFTGIALLFEPGKDFKPEGHKKSVVNYFYRRMKNYKRIAAALILFSFIIAILNFVTPELDRFFVDEILSGKDKILLNEICVALIIVAAFIIIFNLIKEQFEHMVDAKLAIIGNTSFLYKVLHLPMVFFAQRMAGDICDRQAQNATISNTLMIKITPLVLDIVTMIVYFICMIRYSVLLTAIGVFAMVLNFYTAMLVGKKRANISMLQMKEEGKLHSETVAGIDMIETIKAAGAEDGFFSTWSGHQAKLNSLKVSYAKILCYFGNLTVLINEISRILILVLGAYLTMKGYFSIGILIAFQAYLTLFASPSEKIISVGQEMQEMVVAIERVDDVMDYPDDDNFNDNSNTSIKGANKLLGDIELKNVTFGYANLGEPNIKNFSMKLKHGKSVALIGKSGCGKTTLGNLISGLYSPWSGEILFDGKSIKDIDKNVFKSSVAVVNQDIVLYDDTIANNIRMSDESIKDFEVILAARDAGIHNDISMRPNGYQYVMREGGKDFSGGQRQRIEIARALAMDPTIIILDEATSALDAKTEKEVVKMIKDRGITCIIIAHRLSTIRDCDEIIVLDNGKVKERGTHQKLYKKNGLYKKLVINE